MNIITKYRLLQKVKSGNVSETDFDVLCIAINSPNYKNGDWTGLDANCRHTREKKSCLPFIEELMTIFCKNHQLNNQAIVDLIFREVPQKPVSPVLSLYMSILAEKNPKLITDYEKELLGKLSAENFHCLTIPLGSEVEEKLLEEGNFEKLEHYLKNFVLSSQAELKLVTYADASTKAQTECDYFKLLQLYIRVHRRMVFTSEATQMTLLSFLSLRKPILELIGQTSLKFSLFADEAIKYMLDNNMVEYLKKFLSLSYIKNPEIIAEYLRNNPEGKNNILNDFIIISSIRRKMYELNKDCIRKGLPVRYCLNQFTDAEKYWMFYTYEKDDTYECLKTFLTQSADVSVSMAVWCANKYPHLSSYATVVLAQKLQNGE